MAVKVRKYKHATLRNDIRERTNMLRGPKALVDLEACAEVLRNLFHDVSAFAMTAVKQWKSVVQIAIPWLSIRIDLRRFVNASKGYALILKDFVELVSSARLTLDFFPQVKGLSGTNERAIGRSAFSGSRAYNERRRLMPSRGVQ